MERFLGFVFGSHKALRAEAARKRRDRNEAEARSKLESAAQTAFSAPTPQRATEIIADAVAREAAEALIPSTNEPQDASAPRRESLDRALYRAVRDTGKLFHEFEVPRSSFAPGKWQEHYQRALDVLQKLPAVYQQHLPNIMEKLPDPIREEETRALLREVTFWDVVSLAARQCGVSGSAISREQVCDILTRSGVMPEGDAFRNSIITTTPELRSTTSARMLAFLDVATRFVDASEKVAQLQLARLEKASDRVNRETKTGEGFDAYDAYKRALFERVKATEGEEAALYAVAYNLWMKVMALTPVSED